VNGIRPMRSIAQAAEEHLALYRRLLGQTTPASAAAANGHAAPVKAATRIKPQPKHGPPPKPPTRGAGKPARGARVRTG